VRRPVPAAGHAAPLRLPGLRARPPADAPARRFCAAVLGGPARPRARERAPHGRLRTLSLELAGERAAADDPFGRGADAFAQLAVRRNDPDRRLELAHL